MWVRPSDLTGSMEHRFRCKVMDSKDPKNFVYSKYAIVKMKTGKSVVCESACPHMAACFCNTLTATLMYMYLSHLSF